jgi:hypothetical protein
MKIKVRSNISALAVAVTFLCLIFNPARANIITVTNTNDSGPGSLRQALADANDGDTIEFAVTATITLTSGELLADKSITISGPGAANLAVNGNAKSRVFHIASGRTVVISGLTITNAHVGAYGGGIYNEEATLTLNNCIVSDNSADYGGGIYNEAVFADATLTLNNCTISGNSVFEEGGGIYNFGFGGSAIATVNASTFTENSAGFSGGGIRNVGTSVTLVVSNSTVSGNSSYVGAGLSNEAESGTATLEVSNTTLAGNSASLFGGAIYNVRGGVADVTTRLTGTIFKTGASGENIYNSGGTVTSLGFNISSDDGSGFLVGPGDQIETEPMLGSLQDNGGPTLTHALLPGSPAIDTGDPNFTPPPLFDQRGAGYPRIVNGRIDKGSFEVQPGGTPTPTPTPCAGRCTPTPRPRPTPARRP